MLTPQDDKVKPITFGHYIRALRQMRGLTVSKVAVGSTLSAATIYNQESSAFRLIGAKKVELLASFFQLDEPTKRRLFELYESAPLSEFAKKRMEKWAKHREDQKENRDNKTAAAELVVLRDQLATALYAAKPLRYALVMILNHAAEQNVECSCGPEQRICDLCAGLRVLGIDDKSDQWRPGAALLLLESEANEALAFFDAMPTRFDTVTDDDFGGA